METWQKIITICVSVILSTFILQGMRETAPEPIVVQQAVTWAAVILAAIGIVPATITAVIAGMGWAQGRRNAEVAASTAAAVSSNIQKTDTVDKKTTEIHTLTNSNLSEVRAELKVSNQIIQGLNQAQEESARRMASMEQMISSLITPKGEPSPSQLNGEKLDNIKAMLSDVQHGTPPIPVVDEAVLKKLDDVIVGKLDTIQEDVKQTKDKAQDP